jgi:squalene cyclase
MFTHSIEFEGMMMCGTNGSELWDVGFITQALVETGLAVEDVRGFWRNM